MHADVASIVDAALVAHGYEACLHVRKHRRLTAVPVVAPFIEISVAVAFPVCLRWHSIVVVDAALAVDALVVRVVGEHQVLALVTLECTRVLSAC